MDDSYVYNMYCITLKRKRLVIFDLFFMFTLLYTHIILTNLLFILSISINTCYTPLKYECIRI